MIQVVSGLMVQGGAVLMGLRPSGKKRPQLWELPGGKVERGESHEDALVREWREELDVDVGVGEFIAATILEVESTFVVHLYAVEFRSTLAVSQALAHTELRWVDVGYAIENMPCAPAFYLHFQHIRRWLVAQGFSTCREQR